MTGGEPTMTKMFVRGLLVVVVLLAACGDDDDEGDASGGPPREGTSAEWVEGWTNDAQEACGGDCVVFEAVEGETPAAEAQPANFTMRYNPQADLNAQGWATIQDFADEVGCVLPLQPDTPTPINCAAG